MDEVKKEMALKLLGDFERNPMVTNQGEDRNFEEFDKLRVQVISELRPLLDRFFLGEINIGKLKSNVNTTNRRNPLWGFKGTALFNKS